jgi:hypothetical protein
MLNDNLISTYRFHRAHNKRASNKGHVTVHHAWHALELARADLTADRKRYASSPWAKPYRPVTLQPVDSSLPASLQIRERLAYIENPASVGLRFVGVVQTEPGGRNGYFTGKGDNGWFTDPYGDVFKDGTGLCWGVVYQLPARDGKARFVAGYQFGGTDNGPTLDLATIYESDSMRGDECAPVDHDDARDAARIADQMAEHAAETEREYQTAHAAGSRYAETRVELAEVRRSILAAIAAFKAHCTALQGLPDVLKSRLRASIQGDLTSRSDLLLTMAKLASGDDEKLCFYPDARLQAAFCAGAGLKRYPA